MSEHPTLDPSHALLQLAQIDLREYDMDQLLDRVIELAKSSIPGATEVSVSLLQGGKPRTAAFTGDLAKSLDESQYQQGHGPCLSAAQAGGSMLIPDMAHEDRWGEYTPRALKAGVHSSLSIGLPVQEAVTGAMNIYSTETDAFDDEAVELAETFASYAAVALANAHLYSSTAALAQQMQEAMATRAVIEQAKGVLMALHGCSDQEAFDLLTRQSQQTNVKLRDLAADLVRRTRTNRDGTPAAAGPGT